MNIRANQCGEWGCDTLLQHEVIGGQRKGIDWFEEEVIKEVFLDEDTLC